MIATTDRYGMKVENYPFTGVPRSLKMLVEKCFPLWDLQRKNALRNNKAKYHFSWSLLSEENLEDGTKKKVYMVMALFPGHRNHTLHIEEYHNHYRVKGFEKFDDWRIVWKEDND